MRVAIFLVQLFLQQTDFLVFLNNNLFEVFHCLPQSLLHWVRLKELSALLLRKQELLFDQRFHLNVAADHLLERDGSRRRELPIVGFRRHRVNARLVLSDWLIKEARGLVVVFLLVIVNFLDDFALHRLPEDFITFLSPDVKIVPKHSFSVHHREEDLT